MATSTSDHVLPLPLWYSVLRLVQFILAIILLGMAAYGVSVIAYDGLSLTLFTALATIITAVYVLVSIEFYPIAYNYWAVLGLDIFLVVFWLISFALTANEAHHYINFSAEPTDCDDEDFAIRRRECFQYVNTTSSTFRNVLRASAVFGAFEFVLFVVTLVLTGIYLHRHRAAGGHCVAGSQGPDYEMRGGAPPTMENQQM